MSPELVYGLLCANISVVEFVVDHGFFNNSIAPPVCIIAGVPQKEFHNRLHSKKFDEKKSSRGKNFRNKTS